MSCDPRCDLDGKRVPELPDALAAFIQAAGALAAAAAERGYLAAARRVLEDALRALDAGASAFRVIDGAHAMTEAQAA